MLPFNVFVYKRFHFEAYPPVQFSQMEGARLWIDTLQFSESTPNIPGSSNDLCCRGQLIVVFLLSRVAFDYS